MFNGLYGGTKPLDKATARVMLGSLAYSFGDVQVKGWVQDILAEVVPKTLDPKFWDLNPKP